MSSLILLIYFAVSLSICAIIYYEKRVLIANASLLIASIFVALYFALLDPTLHFWDEQYHALVAKRLADNPFLPYLYTGDIVDSNQLNWAGSKVWLHKQPAFLWLMALSIKTFGTTTLAVRIPSVIAHGLLSLVIFRTGTLICDKTVGIGAALLFTFSRYPLELVSGYYSTDHNDLIAMFFVSCAIWCWFECSRSKHWSWAMLVGMFSGLAILTKWLVGLIVLGGWFAVLITSREGRQWKNFVLALLACVLVAAPWQVYILSKFRSHAIHEYNLSSDHLVNVVEGHGGNGWFHFFHLENLYGLGDFMPFLILLGFFVLIWQKRKRTDTIVFISSITIAIYAVFSFAATKMISFPLIVGLVIYLSISNLINAGIQYILQNNFFQKFRNQLSLVAILLVAVVWMDLPAVHAERSFEHPKYGQGWRQNKVGHTFMNLISLPKNDSNYVIYNVNVTYVEHIQYMYYRDFNAAFWYPPSAEDIDKVLSAGLIPVCIDHPYTNHQCPVNDSLIIVHFPDSLRID